MMKYKNVLLSAISLFVFTQIGMAADVLDVFKSPLSAGLDRPVVVYNNWSSYDELSDNVPLTEKLSMDMLNHVVRLKKQGVQIDYYLMDAFWFDVDGGYKTWNKKHWPDGPDCFLKKCRDNGIIPGLWFSTNLIKSGGSPMLNPVSAWKNSVASDASEVSLFEGGYLNDLMNTLQMYADKGFGLFKFDFAYFDAATSSAKALMLPNDIVESNKMAFINALKKFRRKNPHVIIVGYNGFGVDMENTFSAYRKTVDPRWMDVFETLYSGDPRFSDVPMMNIWRSQDIYSDHQVREMACNGVPLARIDNCSFMIGQTGTCYKRGIKAWKSCLILNIARGGRLNVYHGNIDLLSDEDARWIAKVQHVFLPFEQNNGVSIIGGIPGNAETYGYRATSSDGEIYTVVNPSQSVREVMLPVNAGMKGGRILFTDKGFVPRIDKNILMLGPEQMAVVGYGKYDSKAYDLGCEQDVIIPQSEEELPFDRELSGGNTIKLSIGGTSDVVRVILQQRDNNGNPFRSWGGNRNMGQYFKISARQSDKELPVKINYDKVIWSGLSWAVGEILPISSQSPIEIKCSSEEGDISKFAIHLYKIKY
jgi:hypothetical protein